MKLRLIENPDSLRETQKFRRGFHYYPVSSVFLSTTGQIHICTNIITYPEEYDNEGKWIDAWMRYIHFTKCELIAPFKNWIRKDSNVDLEEQKMKPAMIERLCSKCGDAKDFFAVINEEITP